MAARLALLGVVARGLQRAGPRHQALPRATQHHVHAPAGHRRARPAGDAQHHRDAGPGRAHPGLLLQPPAPLTIQPHGHLRVGPHPGVPLPHQPHLRQLLPQQAQRHHPRVALEAPVLHLLQRRLQQPRRAHPAAAGARRHARPAAGPDAGRQPAQRAYPLDVRAREAPAAVQGGQQQAHRRPVVPLRAAQDGDRHHRPVREQFPVQPHRRGDAHAAVFPEPEPQPDLRRRAGVAPGHQGGGAGPQLQRPLREDTYRRAYGAVQGGGVRAQQVPLWDTAATLRERPLR
uniref:Uncharacterized protein n=1 Tax=Zea mays TaxID=4577 RepID=A0A804MEQ6_MAIZE